MEPNEELRDKLTENTEISVKDEPVTGSAPEALQGGRYNLDICPNCLEPNDEDLAVCRYCGQPLNPNAEIADVSTMPEDEKTLEANRAAAVPEKKEDRKKQESGFRRVMPWLGLYLIYYAVTGCLDINRQVKAAEEAGETVNTSLAYLSQGIWFLAGIMMAWPLIKQGWNKIHPTPEKPEEAGDAESSADENAEASAETDTDFEMPESSDADSEADAPAAESEPDELQPEDENE